MLAIIVLIESINILMDHFPFVNPTLVFKYQIFILDTAEIYNKKVPIYEIYYLLIVAPRKQILKIFIR
jgi:hypothetical protein